MFHNRTDAAKQLVKKLSEFEQDPQVVVLAIPRGALPMGALIARALQAPLDVVLVKKVGAPFNSEFALGAATYDTYFIDPLYERADLTEYIKQEVARVQSLLKKRERTYRGKKSAIRLKNKTVIIVDDGIATGRTMYAAISAIKKQNPQKIIIATPVISPDTKRELEKRVDRVISVITPQNLGAISQFYQEFPQVSDEEAQHILQTYTIKD
jgi:putative phosphoribosyl transferase